MCKPHVPLCRLRPTGIGIYTSPFPLVGEGFRERGIGLITSGLLSHQLSQNLLPRPASPPSLRSPQIQERGVNQCFMSCVDTYGPRGGLNAIARRKMARHFSRECRNPSCFKSYCLPCSFVEETECKPPIQNSAVSRRLQCHNSNGQFFVRFPTNSS